ncbi:MAG: asparaginase [Bacteriovoracaceae bacterium]|nr:asparaginase [Bacteriovoracaceae bacterium]
MDKIKRIFVISTGGTIEKTYDENEGTLLNRETILKEKLLRKLRLPYTELILFALMSKDSLYMDDEDRNKIKETIELNQKNYDGIVIFHGTDTMEMTARYCYENLKPLLPVVFTGSMRPLGFEDSDATQNATEAIFAASLMPPAIYLSFHGRLFTAPHARKNKEKRTFETP